MTRDFYLLPVFLFEGNVINCFMKLSKLSYDKEFSSRVQMPQVSLGHCHQSMVTSSSATHPLSHIGTLSNTF
jgi:hypothetical protein